MHLVGSINLPFWKTSTTTATARFFQVMRERSVLVNIMRDIPRQDTQPERHAQLLLCMFKPFFKTGDLRQPEDGSWSAAFRRTENSNQWDAQSTTMLKNIGGMLRQRLAADVEIARRREEARAARAAGVGGGGSPGDEDDIFNAAYGDDDTTGTNVMPPSRNAHSVLAYVNNAKDCCIAAGFSKNDSARLPTAALLSGRTPEELSHDASKIHADQGAADAEASIKVQSAELKERDSRMVVAEPVEEPDLSTATRYDSAAMDPYLLSLRSQFETGKSTATKAAMDERRRATNASVAQTDVGRTSPQQHEAVRRIAEEFGLNRKQRLAFFIFGAAWIARTPTPTADALRLHVSGGAGSGKSYVLRAIVALIDCPALQGVVHPGRLLTVAFQGKQAACVGGKTVHSVTDVPRGDKGKGGALDNTDGQTVLSDEKAARWRNVAAIAIEEVSMVSCQLMGCIQKAAASVKPSAASLPYAGMICVTFGDLNQVHTFLAQQYLFLYHFFSKYCSVNAKFSMRGFPGKPNPSHYNLLSFLTKTPPALVRSCTLLTAIAGFQEICCIRGH